MSYYEGQRFILTPHALTRARERLKLPSDVLLLKQRVYELLEKSVFEFRGPDGCKYYRIPDRYGFYFVISDNNVVITVTEITAMNKINKFFG